MISNELTSLLVQTLTSREVIGVSLGLIVYFSLVSYVVRFRRKIASEVSKPKLKLKKEKKASAKSEDTSEDEPKDARKPRA
ncbi:MAG: hypothetical protein LBU25_11610 [Treponema sp.]|jgi:hypothetical protein|nr:hypothetical protein [Treponema sp.]